MDNVNISIAKDYSRFPGPRYEKEGNFSGEIFRKEKFFPLIQHAIEKNIKVIIDLDGTAGYGTSFLEETFGGLIREHNLQYDHILKHIEIKSSEEE
jgi:hypothetical protein